MKTWTEYALRRVAIFLFMCVLVYTLTFHSRIVSATAWPLFDLALTLDGADDYASAPDDPTLDLGTADGEDFTIETFFYVADLTNTTNDTLFWKQGSYGLYILYFTDQADRFIYRVFTGPTTYVYVYYETELSVGWHHVAAVFDNEYTGSGDLFALYVDGSLAASSTAVDWTPGIPNSSNALNIGAYTGINPLNGWMEETRFSNVVRYSGATYSVPAAAFEPDGNTRALWHFDEDWGATTFADSSGNENTLTGLNGAQIGNPSGSQPATSTSTPSSTATQTLVHTPTRTNTPTRTPTSTATQTSVNTPTDTSTPTNTPTNTSTRTPTRTSTSTSTSTSFGGWSGTTNYGHPVSFIVNEAGSQWNTFKLTTNFAIGGCSGTLTITIPGPGTISSNQFSYSGSTFSFVGSFTSPTAASGTFSFTNHSTGCGSFTQSGTWSASGQMPSTPTGQTPTITWSGTTNRGKSMSFDINNAGNQWSNFELSASYTNGGCTVTLTKGIPGPGAITNKKFSWSSSTFSFTGQFTSSTAASGTYSFTNHSTGCGSFTQSGTWAATGHFYVKPTKTSTPLPAPVAFGKTSPVKNALKQSTSPTLKWAASKWATSYEYCLDTVNNNSCDTSWTSRTTTSASLSGLINSTVYYWQVRALNGTGATEANAGAWWSFKVKYPAPVLVAPNQDEHALVFRPAFDWEDESDAGVAGYTLQISKNNTFTQVVHTGSPVGSSYVPTVDLPKNATLYWRVLTRGANGPSSWSSVRSFKSANSPSTPLLSLPAQNALTGDAPLFKWSVSSLPIGTSFKHYQLQVDDSFDFSSPVINEYLTDRLVAQYQVVAPLEHNTAFYWRVQAVNMSDEVSNWSTGKIRVQVDPPTLVTSCNFDAMEPRPLLDWDPPSGAGLVTGYTVQISKTPSFSQIVGTGNTAASNSEYTSSTDLPKNTLLYWRVQTKGANGPSGWSTVCYFLSANSPSTPVLRAPARNALLTDDTPVLKWSAVTLPAATTFQHYQVQVDDDADFSSPLINDTSITNRTTTEFQIVTPLVHNTRYYWRVRAVNAANEVSSWSASWYLRIKVDAPILLAPGNGTIVDTLQPVFDWEDATGPGKVTNYTIQVSTSSTFATLLVNSTAVDSTYRRLTGFPARKTLYWRVRVNGANGPSAWSTVYSFTTP